MKAADKKAREVYDRSKEWVERQTKYQKLTLKEQLEVWEAIQGQFIKESKQYAEAEEKIFDLKAKMQDEYSKKVEEVNKKITDLEKNYQDALEKRTQEIFNSYKLFDKAADKEEVSGQELVSNLQSQVNSMRDFYTGLRDLSARGVGEALVEEIKKMGPSAANQLDALLALSDEKLTEYANLYQQKQHLANNQAVEELRALRAETNRQIQESMNEISDIYGKSASYIGQNVTSSLSDGMMSGLENARASLDEAIAETGRTMEAVIKSVGGIEYSPDVDYSKLMMAAGNMEEFQELAAKRNAKIIGGNMNLVERSYADNAQLLEDWTRTQEKARENTVESVEAITETISGAIRSILDSIPEMGRQFSENFADGIRSGLSDVAAAAANVAREAAETLERTLAIDIPALSADIAPTALSGRSERDERIEDIMAYAERLSAGRQDQTSLSELGQMMISAVRDGMSNMGVYMADQKVGRIITEQQRNDRMSMGR